MNIYCDGGSRGNPGLAAIGYIAYDDDGRCVAKFASMVGKRTNNEAEIMAVLKATGFMAQYKEGGTIYSDSALIVGQINGEMKIEAENLKTFHHYIKQMVALVEAPVAFRYVDRISVKDVDELVGDLLDNYLEDSDNNA